MSCSMEMALWFEKCYEEKEKEKEKVPQNGKEAIAFIKNYIKVNYPVLDIIRGGGIKGGKGCGNWCRIKHSKWRNSSVFDGPFIILEDKDGFEGIFTTNSPFFSDSSSLLLSKSCFFRLYFSFFNNCTFVNSCSSNILPL